jgi:hypothetical protein
MKRGAWCSAGVLAMAFLSGCGAGDETEESFSVEVHGAAHDFVLTSEAGVREGPNAFDLEVDRIDGSALDAAATVTVVVRMSAMTHGDQEVGVTRLGGSSFAVEDVVFAMPGTWELEVSVEEGSSIDRATFELDVP